MEVTVSVAKDTRGLMKLAVGAMSALLFGGGVVLGSAFAPQAVAQETTVNRRCGASSGAQVRTTLYFGLARPKGSVSELEWQMFLRDDVTARFPEGLTVWDASGQWRRSDGQIEHEGSKVLLLVHPDTAAAFGRPGRHRTVPSEVRPGIGPVGDRLCLRCLIAG
jgi:hypothetical protein